MALFAVLLIAGCASLPPAASLKSHSSALDPSVTSPLEERFAPIAAMHHGASGFRLLSRGIDGLIARIELIDAAQHTVDIQSYIFRADESGGLIALALLRAADRGVRVRILLDDGETIPGDERILSLATKSGIQVRIFNPLTYRGHVEAWRAAEFLFDKARLDYRMHNKLMVADNAAAIIGGRNIGDQYFQIDPSSQFGDEDVVAAGPIVPRLSAVFDEFWNGDLAVPAPAIDRKHTSEQAYSRYRAELAQSPPAPPARRTPLADIMTGAAPLIWAPVQLAYDSPDKKVVVDGKARGRLIYKAVLERAKLVNSELLIVTPYFIPSPDELSLLDSDRDRQVRVSVLTNSLPAAPNLAAQSGYMHYRIGLLQHGVALYEERARVAGNAGTGQPAALSRYGNYALHAKLYVFDRRTLFIGSMNYDQRSRHLNTEVGLLIDSPDLARAIAVRFEELTQLDNAYTVSLEKPDSDGTAKRRAPHLLWTTREAGGVVRYTTEPARSGWQRLHVRLLALLPLDKEL